MPLYTLIDKNTNREESFYGSYSELEIYLKENANLEQTVPKKLNIVSGYSGQLKPDREFRNLLTTIKKSTKGDNINDY